MFKRLCFAFFIYIYIHAIFIHPLLTVPTHQFLKFCPPNFLVFHMDPFSGDNAAIGYNLPDTDYNQFFYTTHMVANKRNQRWLKQYIQANTLAPWRRGKSFSNTLVMILLKKFGHASATLRMHDF